MIRTRFAPSPTGYLHIGGVRTALFNWIFARKHKGAFILRVDDTDQQRNVEQAIEPILSGFQWLGIDWDEGPVTGGDYGPYFQSQRTDRYAQAVQELLERGLAYHDYATTAEIQQERETAQQKGVPFLYSRRWMAEDESTRRHFESQGRTSVVRMKTPREGSCEFQDLIRGPMSFEWSREQDLVIQRADGSCLYHLASVVDDHDMKISHVIRAEEHLSNTPRQILIAESLGFELPCYAHIPVVSEPGSKTKLSKRKLAKYLKNRSFSRIFEQGKTLATRMHLELSDETFNPVIVDFYRRIGYLSDALINYLLLLGWSLDDKTEYFTRSAMIDLFSLERVNNSPASFDPEKLLAFQDHYMQQLPLDEKETMAIDCLQRAQIIGNPETPVQRERIHRILLAAAERVKIAGDILDYSHFFIDDVNLDYDENSLEKRLKNKPESQSLLVQLRDRLEQSPGFEPTELEALFHQFVQQHDIKPNAVIHALRVATTGQPVGFGMFDTLSILGKTCTLNRITRALERVCKSDA